MASKKKDPIAEAGKRITEIDNEVKKLTKEKAELSKVLLAPKKEIPLHQLNLIARVGADKAKKQLGNNWVEVE